METWDAITARRNVRQYKSDPVSEADLNRIAEAGWRAPSAKNRQAWDFVIVTDKAQLQELSTVWQGAGHIAGAAAAIAFVIPETPTESRQGTDQYDVGQATMAMMIAATDLGIGTGHSSVGDQDKARAILGVPDGYEVAYLMGVGYPADRPLKPIRKPNRRPFDEVVHHGHWGSTPRRAFVPRRGGRILITASHNRKLWDCQGNSQAGVDATDRGRTQCTEAFGEFVSHELL